MAGNPIAKRVRAPPAPKSRTKLLAGIIVVLVIVIGFLGYCIMTAGPGGEEKPITTASEAGERISNLQEQLQSIADDLRDISESL